MADSNNLVVLTFQGAGTAAAVYEQIVRMEEEKQVKLKDAIIIEREGGDAAATMSPAPSGSGQGGVVPITTALDDNVRVRQTHGKKGAYAAKGGGIGLLAGFLLGGPVGGLVVGAGLGAITAAMKDLGIDDKNIEAIKSRLEPNSSALLLLGTVADKDAFVARLRTYDPKVISSSLAPEVEKQLREQFEG
jgi:uncharacterized membrane protein